MTGSARIAITGGEENSNIGSVTIGGSFTGYNTNGAIPGIFGNTAGGGKIGAIKIGGDWKASYVGEIYFHEVTSITLGGSLIGGADPGTNYGSYWHGDKVGAIKIGGDLIGGGGKETGRIQFTTTASVTIVGSLRGGSADMAGSIGGNIGTLSIGRDLIGGSLYSGSALYAGAITAASVGTLTIGGSLIAGTDNSSGTLNLSGAIAVGKIGSLTIKGNVIGNSTLAAQIQVADSIKTLSIGGRVELGQVYLYNKGAQLGTLTVAGDWIASDVAVGVGIDSSFGSGNESRSILGVLSTPSKIASIVIKGQVLGQVGNTSRTFGFGAEEIGSFVVGKGKLPLTAGAHNDKFAAAGVTGDALPVGSTTASGAGDGRAVHVFEI